MVVLAFVLGMLLFMLMKLSLPGELLPISVGLPAPLILTGVLCITEVMADARRSAGFFLRAGGGVIAKRFL